MPVSEKYKYQKYYAEDASNAMSLVRNNIEANGLNLQRLKSLMQLMQDDISKALRRGASSNGKVSLYMEQIQKR